MAFEPKFIEVKDEWECADHINRPHGDYPKYVNKTAKVLHDYMGMVCCTEYDARCIHGAIFKGREQEITVGHWRKIQAHVLDKDTGEEFHYPDPIKVPELVYGIFPVGDTHSLVNWYKKFQEIHPFDDGNGRVGGIIVATLHWSRTGKWLAPCQ